MTSPDPEARPAGLSSFSSDAQGLLVRYHGWLAGAGIERGLIGPREGDRLWERHILNSAVVEQCVEGSARVADIGSGAGLPGIPLACVRPDLTVVLVEPMQRRVDFLAEVVGDLTLTDRVRVVRGRADEVVAEVGPVDVVTGRAVAPLAKFAGWAAPLLGPSGRILALKGDNAEAEIADAARALQRLKLKPGVIRSCTLDGLTVPTRVVELCQRR